MTWGKAVKGLSNDGTSFVDHLCCFLSCVCHVFSSVYCCLMLTCWEGLTLALFCDLSLCFCHISMWYPGLGVVLDCTDFRSLP